VVPFSINAEQWNDHASAERFLALPGTTTAKMYDSPVSIPGGFYSGQVFFPKDGVLAKTVALEMERGNPASRRNLETQILHFDGTAWHGYTYLWNDEQTDAVLVPAAGTDRTLTVLDAKAPGGKRKQTWHVPSRAQCLTCHNPWAGHTLAFTLPQLHRDHTYGGVADNQVRALKHVHLIELLHHDEESDRTTPLQEPPAVKLTNPYDATADLNARARSYLQVNCSHCHQFGAGGTADIELRHTFALDQTKTLEVRPVQGTFGIPGAHLLSPGDPYRSVLYYRMAKLGPGRMPHIGSEIVDERGLRLIHDWIRQLPVRKDERALIEKLRGLDEPSILQQERVEWKRDLARLAREIARKHDRNVPSAEDVKEAEVQLKAQAAQRAKGRAAERTETIKLLLSSTPSALMLAHALGENTLAPVLRQQVLAAAQAHPDPQIRDLFERFLPDEQRVKRLGSVIKPGQILALKGDAQRGRELFFKAAGLQCVNCHRIAGTGSTLGPDLTAIGKKYTRAQILESILEPSKSIDPKYVAYLVETTDGKIQTGLLAEKTDKEVVLNQIGDKQVRFPLSKVATLVPQRTSLMPELLLRDLTAEQAADLLEFLASLK
jgi:putative heme-binding domain-containing protein